MTCGLSMLLGVMLLTFPDEKPVDRAAAASLVAEADAGMRTANPMPLAESGREKGATITSERSDFDREAKVVMFEKNVCVTYASDYVLHSDRLFVFLGGSNALSRVVAVGNVTITNQSRVGTCQMAKFWKRSSEIEMFGDGYGKLANLKDATGNDLKGVRIRFWLDSEQVDVDRPEIQVEKKKEDGKAL